MGKNAFLTIAAHVIGIVTMFIMFIPFFNIDWDYYFDQPTILFLINSIYIGYYIFIGTLCNPYSRRHQLVSLIPLSVFGALFWLLALVLYIPSMNNPFAGAIWMIELLYNGNCILLLIVYTVNFFSPPDNLPIYITLKLLYNILFPSVFIFAGMELKRLIIRKREISTNQNGGSAEGIEK